MLPLVKRVETAIEAVSPENMLATFEFVILWPTLGSLWSIRLVQEQVEW